MPKFSSDCLAGPLPCALPLPRHAVAAPADQAGAHQRRQRGGISLLRQGKAKAGVGDRVGGEAAVPRVAGEQRPVAQVLAVAAAIGAYAAGTAEPGHADARTDRRGGYAGPMGRDPPDDLVPGHDRQLGVRQIAVDHVEIGAAHPAGLDLDQDFSRARRRHRPLTHHQGRAGPVENHRTHGCRSSSGPRRTPPIPARRRPA